MKIRHSALPRRRDFFPHQFADYLRRGLAAGPGVVFVHNSSSASYSASVISAIIAALYYTAKKDAAQETERTQAGWLIHHKGAPSRTKEKRGVATKTFERRRGVFCPTFYSRTCPQIASRKATEPPGIGLSSPLRPCVKESPDNPLQTS
ncbi:MAG: hypothetical protein Pg6C_06460 [Treponemataceae bacterium]|nr:MAG: hypothetical protein Pg6C_06460 [Treponemataceae bacterium]